MMLTGDNIYTAFYIVPLLFLRHRLSCHVMSSHLCFPLRLVPVG